jgi:hypothetical protein
MSITESAKQADEETANLISPATLPERDKSLKGVAPTIELGLWLRALRSFFQVNNHPFSEANQASVLTRDWSHEARIASQVLRRCTQLTLLHLKIEREVEALVDGLEKKSLLVSWPQTELGITGEMGNVSGDSIKLGETLQDASTICDALIKTHVVDFHVWMSLGKMLTGELTQSNVARALSRAADKQADAETPSHLRVLARERIEPDKLGADIQQIFMILTRLLERLGFIEKFLAHDQPLKQTLPIFTLIHEEARELQSFIETRTLYLEGLGGNVFEALDGLNYGVAMELRKVFSRELVGLSALRQAPAIYSRVEAAHGMLRECFQQSTITLAKLFDSTLGGAQLFDAFRTKLKNSLALREDLWLLLQLVRRVEQERDMNLRAPLLERLREFGNGSKFFLMYKDWEACERFTEEAEASRTITELLDVLHRFAPYLETLHGQVSMRTVLVNHPSNQQRSEN